ncbi:MAG: UDP-2,3-diacylglucosamine diphosphatase [Gammaproteobacteria bacterium]|nr:UDP-2,3-diacylglucosamine diphosphatase [Gammaproteobacteria bacterium]
MTEPILFISDLHLEESRPDITAALLRFLEQHAGCCHSLFILGDLFEVWIGDDESTTLTRQVAAALEKFAKLGTQLYLMHGNRDFLIGETYAQECGGVRLIREPYRLETDTCTYLLVHGDSLCTDDTEYQQFRSMVRDPHWQKGFLTQSLTARRDFARQARQESQVAIADKSMAIMDVNSDSVIELLRSQQLNSLIHGHTHRPAFHNIELDPPIAGQNKATRLVLGDWDKAGWYARLAEGNLSLHNFRL